MHRRNMLLFVVLGGLVLVGLLAACGGGEQPGGAPPREGTPAGADSPVPPADLGGEELLQARCTRCHSLDQVQAASKDLAAWEDTVERMRRKGAELTDAEAQTLVQYLAETYP